MNSSDHLLLTSNKLDVGTISALVSHDSCGAISLFVGTTRDNFNNKRVTSLEYEAYEPMAIKEMQNICSLLRSRWADVFGIAIHHRVGLVPVGEASVVIAVSSPHRQSALDGVSFAIEQLKQKVPIWKKELYEDDESAWKQNQESAVSDKNGNIDMTSVGVEISPVPVGMIQISAEEQEIDKRIESFIRKKREFIDFNNIMDYTEHGKISNFSCETSQNTEGTSARTNTHIVKQEQSKCHLKVRRVRNATGPQTRPKYLQALDKLRSHEPNSEKDEPIEISEALHNRIESVEDYLHIYSQQFSKSSIYVRLKAIEDRILHLESISPEYWQFMIEAGDSINKASNQNSKPPKRIIKKLKRKTYTVDDLDSIINQIESRSDLK